MKLRTQLLLGYVIVFMLMIGVGLVTYQSINALIANQDSQQTAQEIKTRARLYNRLQSDMAAAVRAFALSGDELYLSQYAEAQTSAAVALGELESMINDPAQESRLKEIASLAARWGVEAAEPLVQARRDVGSDAADADLSAVVALFRRGAGNDLLEAITTRLDAFVVAEDQILAQRAQVANDSATRSLWVVLFGTLAAIALGMTAMFVTTRAVLRQVGGEPAVIAAAADRIAHGELGAVLGDDPAAGTGIRAAMGEMLHTLSSSRDVAERQDWLKSGISRLDEVMRGDPDIDTLVDKVMTEIATYLDAQVGALYLVGAGNEPLLTLKGSYAYTKRKNLSNVFKFGEGLVGQAALEKKQILLKNVPEDYIRVTSGLGERVPRFICVTPFLYGRRVKGVIEIGTLNEVTERELEYLSQVMPALAIAVQSGESRTELASALHESQQLTEELQTQQEELQTTNEELETQTQRLSESEETLKAQQEELQVSNEELEEKNELLERQKREVERARKDIEEKSEEVALASKYKSEFLANMSHELRTPLNSLLLLAQELVQNKEGNLTPDQVESAKIIHGGGSDLATLINEILDLSKIEAGRMDLQLETVRVSDLADGVRATFQHMAEDKSLGLDVVVQEGFPAEITSDRMRVEQVIRNLVSNAIKFTETGSVTVTFGRPAPGTDLSAVGLSADECMAVAVRDTGIGIAAKQQKVIFEAFQQADGGTARKYGGTGLGLTISRELARLLGGLIRLESDQGEGSTFTLYLPVALNATRKASASAASTGEVPRVDLRASRNAAIEVPAAPHIKDDREDLVRDEKVILVVEDDPRFATILQKKCHEKGFKCLATPTGEEGLELAAKYLPCAVLLDIHLPGIDGWAVLASLKDDIRTRHIPVHVLSADEASTEALSLGAVGHATKPLSQKDLDEAFGRLTQIADGERRRVLVVEDNAEIRRRTVELLGDGDVKVDEAQTGEQTLEALRSNRYDCVILDLGLPDMDGGELLAKLEHQGVELPPVIIYTARDLTLDEESILREHAESIVIKDVRSPERLLDEVSLFLHRVVDTMPEPKGRIIRDLHDTDALFRDKKVLIVDDDMRTTFALSRLLSGKGMKPLKAENGEKALRMLEQQPDVDLVLMDIMMPVMDGYEAIGKIRAQERFRKLPIIALTAKAMPQDREKCIVAGANDYLPKPMDAGRLFSMMRVWLYR